jgi:hypothetical protein
MYRSSRWISSTREPTATAASAHCYSWCSPFTCDRFGLESAMVAAASFGLSRQRVELWMRFPALSHRRDNAQLLHQAEVVCLNPLLRDLALD